MARYLDRSSGKLLWTGLSAVVLALISGTSKGQEGKPVAIPFANKQDEPLAETFSLARSAEFLDDVTLAWFGRMKCAACHTGYPYLLARASLGGPEPSAVLQVRKFFEDRVVDWDRGGKGAGYIRGEGKLKDTEGVSEVVAVAATLALHDSHSTGKLHPRTRQALDRMWELQREDGAWDWNKTGLTPLEHDDYYGAVFAAVGVGHAPEEYAQEESAQEGISRLRRYLRTNPPPDLHHKAWLLWASDKLDGVLEAAEREKAIQDLLAIQRDDGGWSLPSLGDWKRRDGAPNDKQAPSDGYATGLVVHVLRKAGVDPTSAPIQRGLEWLKTNQRASGRWFTRSLNRDTGHYIANAGTAFAVLALQGYADDSWVGRDVLKAKPRVFADRDGDKKVYFELKGAWIPVLKDEDGRLRVRGYDGQEGWAEKADFVLLRDATNFFSKVIRQDEKNAWAHNMRGIARAMQGEVDAAIDDYTQAIRLDPNFGSAFVGRGGAWGAKKEFDKAILDYDQALRLDPANAHPLGPAHIFNARGNMWGAKREYDKAIGDYHQAIRLDPTCSLFFNHRGNAWLEKEEYARAILDYDECIRLGSKDTRLNRVDASVFVNRGDARRAKKEYTQALRDYDEAIRLDGKYDMALARKAYLLATCADDKLRDVAQAEELLKGVVKLRPNSPYNEELLGIIAASQGNFDEAIRRQKKALEDKAYADRQAAKARQRLTAYEARKPHRE